MSIDNIRQIPIVDVISKHVPLKKKGSNYVGCCPFHDEKTGSFTVSETRNIYKCFGCGVSGDGIKFYQEKFGLKFLEACKQLAQEHNILFETHNISETDFVESKKRHEIFILHNAVSTWYAEQLQNNKEALKYAKSRISEENIEKFSIGFAPPGYYMLFNAMRELGYKEEFLLESGLFVQKDNGKVFDFFQNRIMFPIKSFTGDIVGFGGRVMDNSQPKYLNSKENNIFSKGKYLYGIHESAKAIHEKDAIILTEGYTDVTSMHEGGNLNTVGMLGTALTEDHVKLLTRYTNNVIICADADSAGERSMFKSAELLIRNKFRVSVITNIPPGHDPDSYFRHKDNQPKYENFLILKADKLFGSENYDPMIMADNMREMSFWLNLLIEEERASMIEYITSKYRKKGITKKNIENAVKQDKDKNRDEDRHTELDESMLPDYVDREEYRKYGFYASQGLKGDTYARNQYIFDNGGRVSNFTLEPLFHIDGESEVKKIFKAINKYGEKKIIELDLDALNSLPRFRKLVEEKGNFLFEGTDKHLQHLKRMWYDKTDYCKRIETLGWQTEGFWAWANGITTMDDTFCACDENGIIEHDGQKYFIAPFASIYRSKQNMFASERKFMYVKNELSLNEWLKQFIAVYGNQGMISFAYYLSAIYSDYIFSIEKALPMLNIYGQKGTGKNEQAMSLTALFGYIQDPCQIHNTTKAGLSAHLEEFSNSLAWIDEYKNSIPLDYLEILKAIYNRIGRNKKSLDSRFGKETTSVTSMGVITGQEMLTADIALFSRVICLMYYKTEFTKEEEQNLERLQLTQSQGLSHITARLIRHRKIVIDNYKESQKRVRQDMEKRISTNQSDGRILKNYIVILTTFLSLEKIIECPFTYDQLLDECVKSLLRQNEMLYNSNELSTFWSIIEHGVETRQINEGSNYRIKMVDFLRVTDKINDNGNNKKYTELAFNPPKEVMLLKWAGIYQFYSETARRTTQHALPETTLLHYLNTSSYYIGKVRSVRFSHEVNQAIAFDYDEIRKNLKRKEVTDNDLIYDDTEKVPEEKPSYTQSNIPYEDPNKPPF